MTNSTLNAPTNLGASATPRSSIVNLTWDRSTLSTSTPAQGYYVTRTKDSDSTTKDACGSSATALTTDTTCTDSPVPDGTFHYTVTAVYYSWTAVSQASTSITIDTTAPAAPTAPTLTPGSDSGSSSTDGITNVTTPTFIGTAEVGATVTLYDGATPVGTGVATGGKYSVMSSALTPGTKAMTVTATDVAGNVGPASTITTVTIDITAPAAPDLDALPAASDSGSSSTDGITNVTTPTFTGTAEDGSTVTLYDGATPVGTAVATSGAYSVTSSALTEGVKTMTVTATDVAGNLGPSSTDTTVTIDITAPAAPSAPALIPDSDSGSSSTDGITNIRTPTFTGTAEDGATVTLYNGAMPVGTAPVAIDGAYSVTSSTLANGTKTMTVTATDVAGNLGPSPTSTITIDFTAPNKPAALVLTPASDTGRSNTDKNTNVTAPTVTGTTAEAGTTVILYDGPTTPVQVGSTTTATTSFTITSSTLTDAAHTITATATDPAGNVSVPSTAVTVTIDTIAPAAPSNPDLKAASDTGKSSTDNITKTTNPIITGTNETKAIVILYDGPTQVGSATTTATSSSITSSTLTEGPHTLTATATDIAGNLGPASGGTTITIDTTAPDAPSAPTLTTASDTGISPTDGLTNDPTPTLTGTAENGVTVALFDVATATGTAVTATGGAYSATTATLITGSHTITAKATDVAGNVGLASSITSVTIDTTKPTVTINQAVGQADPTAASPINFTAVFSESVYGLTSTGVTHTGTAAATMATVTGADTTFNVAVSGMSKNGTVISKVLASAAHDAAGNVNLTSTTATVTYDTTSPTVAISSFAPGALQSATVSGTAGFGPGDTSTVTVVFCTTNVFPCLAGDTKATLTPSVNATTGAWSDTSGTLGTNATLYARATQTDLAGNTGQSLVAGPIAIP